MRRSLWSTPGRAALEALASGRVLLAFDFDGTLAPLVPDPHHARAPAQWVAWLRVLGRRWPLAVLSGRSVADLERRLGFDPRFLVGNHGAQARDDPVDATLAATLDRARASLAGQAGVLGALGVTIEDKGLSLALHYRRAADPDAARRALRITLPWQDPGVRIEPGHRVFNITPAIAPDKGDALLAAMAACGATRALVVGDDLNDELAFRKAPAGSVTVRVGPPSVPSAAHYALASQVEVGWLLSRLLEHA